MCAEVPKRLAERYMDTEEAFLAMAGSIGWRLKERERSEEFNNQRELVYVRGSTNGFLARNAVNYSTFYYGYAAREGIKAASRLGASTE